MEESPSLPQRDPETGRLLPGNTANPEGKNGHLEGWQRYGDRLQKWFATPVEELEMYLLNEGAKLRKLSSIDAACCRHVINTISGKETLKYLKEALNRIEGTPTQTIKHQGDKEQPFEFKFSLDFHSPEHDDPVKPPNDSELPAAPAVPEAE